MTRVLHVVKTASGGRFVGYQLQALAPEALDLHLLLPGEGVLAEMARNAGVSVHVDPRVGASVVSAGAAVGDVTRNAAPDLIHAHFVHSALAARAGRRLARRDTPIFFQVPGPLHLEHGWSRNLEIRTAGPRDHWGPACQWSYNRYLNSNVPASRVHLTYYGKHIEDYSVDQEPPSSIRHELGLTGEDYLVVMVAHVYPPRRGHRRGIKGHEDFIKAIKLARRIRPSIAGVIVGGPRPGAQKYFDRLKKTASSAVGIHFLGARDDVQSIYSSADLAVHPSHSENIGGAGESLLMAVPTITTNVGGFNDVLRPGVSGLMVAPRRPEDLADKIVEAFESMERMRGMAKVGRSMVLQVGDARANAQSILNVYHRMVRAC